jgi:hypothetical protein
MTNARERTSVVFFSVTSDSRGDVLVTPTSNFANVLLMIHAMASFGASSSWGAATSGSEPHHIHSAIDLGFGGGGGSGMR